MRALLDNVTDNVSLPSQTVQTPHYVVDEETGEILPSYNPLIKWELHAAAKQILSHKKSHRISKCCSFIRPDYLKEKKAIEIRGGVDRNPYFVGFMVCGLIYIFFFFFL